VRVNGTFQLQNGVVRNGGTVLELGPTASIVGESAQSYITGTVRATRGEYGGTAQTFGASACR
jgi:hypothetical protein